MKLGVFCGAFALSAFAAAPASATLLFTLSGHYTKAGSPDQFDIALQFQLDTATSEAGHPDHIVLTGPDTSFLVNGVDVNTPGGGTLMVVQTGPAGYVDIAGGFFHTSPLGYVYAHLTGNVGSDLSSQALFDSLIPTVTGDFARNMVQYDQISDFSLTVSGTMPRVHISPVPELASWTMMLGGFGLIGTLLRRRQRVTFSFG